MSDMPTPSQKKPMGCFAWLGIGFIAFLLIMAFSGWLSSRPQGVEVTRADMGDDWPLTVESGYLDCDDYGRITFTVDGNTYGVNGSAQDKYQGIDSIWTDRTDIEGLKVDIGPLIERGQDLCS